MYLVALTPNCNAIKKCNSNEGQPQWQATRDMREKGKGNGREEQETLRNDRLLAVAIRIAIASRNDYDYSGELPLVQTLDSCPAKMKRTHRIEERALAITNRNSGKNKMTM